MDNLPKRKPLRLKNYDYSQNGCYFVTVCTYQKQNLFETSTVGNDLCVVPKTQNIVGNDLCVVPKTQNIVGNDLRVVPKTQNIVGNDLCVVPQNNTMTFSNEV